MQLKEMSRFKMILNILKDMWNVGWIHLPVNDYQTICL